MTELQYALAQRLMNLHNQTVAKPSARAIFGSGAELTANLSRQMTYRIGLWPCVSEHQELSLYLWSTLAHLLETRTNVQIYRLFANLGATDSKQIETETLETQFTVDDWIFEQLNENSAVWGNLYHTDNQYTLKIYLESDFWEDTENTLDQTFTTDNLSQLINQLPHIADFIIENIGGEKDIKQKNVFVPPLPDATNYQENQRLLEATMDWELIILSFLWGVEIDDEEINHLFETLMTSCEFDVDYWLVGSMLYQATLPGLSLIGELLIDEVLEYEFPVYSNFSVFILRAMLRLGRVSDARDLLTTLEQEYGRDNFSVYMWLTYADVLIRTGDLANALDIFQSAIENNGVSIDLYRLYAYALELTERYNVPVSTFILIDPSEKTDDRLLWEAISAYDEILHLDPENVLAISQKLQHLIVLDIPEFWNVFEQLVEKDGEHDFISEAVTLIENHDFDDFDTGIQLLQNQIENSRDFLLEMDLLRLLVLDDQLDNAKSRLNELKNREEAIQYTSELDYLTLIIAFDNFSYWLGEIQTILDAGNRLSYQNIELLEKAIEIAPNMTSLHILYAKALLRDDNPSDALDHLLDVHESDSQNVIVITAIVETLRQFDDNNLTIDYIKKGLICDSNYGPLLIQASHFYLDIKEHESVRSLVTQLEANHANNPELKNLRERIAQELN